MAAFSASNFSLLVRAFAGAGFEPGFGVPERLFGLEEGLAFSFAAAAALIADAERFPTAGIACCFKLAPEAPVRDAADFCIAATGSAQQRSDQQAGYTDAA